MLHVAAFWTHVAAYWTHVAAYWPMWRPTGPMWRPTGRMWRPTDPCGGLLDACGGLLDACDGLLDACDGLLRERDTSAYHDIRNHSRVTGWDEGKSKGFHWIKHAVTVNKAGGRLLTIREREVGMKVLIRHLHCNNTAFSGSEPSS